VTISIPAGARLLESLIGQVVDALNKLLAADPVTALVATSQTTTSTSYVDLTTAGPAQTVTVGASGIVEVVLTGNLSNSGSNYSVMGVALSGANTAAASDVTSLQHFGTAPHRGSYVAVLTGLTPGSTTFTAKYRVTGGTGTFVDRAIIVRPRGR
jgi:hypothetical protein